MTEQDIEKAFADVLNNSELKNVKTLNKFDRYNLKNKTYSTAKKLEILWKLDKLKLNEPT